MEKRDVLERLSRLPRVQRLALVGLAYLVAVALFWTLLYSPAGDALAAARAEQVQLDAERQKVRSRAENREAFEQELQQLTEDLKKALRELPNSREIPELLKKITTVGKQVGLEVRRFQPLPEVIREYYAEVPVALEVGGSYHEVAMFFDHLAKLGRIVYVEDIEISEPEDRGGKVYLTVTGKAVTFRFLTEDEIGRQEKATQRRGGRKDRRRSQ